jgi:hypothetical protein
VPRGPKNLADVKSLARQWTKTSIEQLGGIATKGSSEAARVAACIALLDRGWNKPGQPQNIAGADGESTPEMIIRHIYEGKAKGEK